MSPDKALDGNSYL